MGLEYEHLGELMANRSRPSQQKRHKERARQEKQKMKLERRQEAKARPRMAGMPGEDPDIAGIIPGPQPLREDQMLDAPPLELPADEKPEV
jgi:hypothetical protein